MTGRVRRLAIGGRRHAGPLAALVLVATLVAACGATNSENQPTVLTVDHAGFQLTVPDGWSAQAANNIVGPLQTVAFLSSVDLDMKCTGSGTGRHCRVPRAIDDGSMLVTWLAAFCAGTSCTPPAGQPILVGGREASLVNDTDLCQPLEPTKEETFFVAVSPQRLDAIVVCERDAPAAAETALREMLEHVEWRTP